MRWRALLLGCSVALAAAAPAGALEPGGTEFWTEREHVLEVAPGGWRLRVGLDKHTVADGWRAQIDGPNGSASIRVPPGLYSGEAFVERPEAGRWIVRVTDDAAQDRRFRMRAKLEREPVNPAGDPVDELPNLQAMPPWDFTFEYPVTNGTTDPPQGIPLPGGRLACHLEEILEDQAVRCLRMAFGVRNTGRGPMDLLLGQGAAFADRPLVQKVHRSDGSSAQREAGTARFHRSHAHYHQDKAIALELLRIEPGGTLAPAADVHLKGFAHRDELLREWTMFHPDSQMEGFGLSAGWADYYEWDRPGNYIDFGLNGDGRYVLRLTADPAGGVLESNESDNAGYSVVEVKGERVELLESGRGTGPGDRCRILVPLGPEPALPEGMAPHPRPADCPPDTTDPDPPVSAGVSPMAPAAKPAPAGTRKKAGRKRCPKLRRGMSRHRRAAVRRCRRGAAKQRRKRAGRSTAAGRAGPT